MKSKTLAMVLVAVLCLAVLGVGFAKCSDVMASAGTVNTCEFSLEFTDCTCTDPPGTDDPGYTEDIGYCQCMPVDSDSDGDDDMVQIRVTNAYPRYWCDFEITVRNNGTIPAKITEVLVNEPDPEAIELNGEGFWSGPGLVGTVLDPGETTQASFSLHILQQISQGKTYNFSIQIEAVQDN